MRGVGAGVFVLAACGVASVPASDQGSSGGSSSGGTKSAGITGGEGTTAVATDGGGSGDGDTTGSADSADGGSSSSGDAWVLEFHTVLTDAGRLAIESNLPFDVTQCPAGAPCDDVDGDGLNDTWEDLALDRLRPLRRFDEAEPAITDDTAVLADVGRVFPFGDAIQLFVMLGYSLDYGSCGLTGHHGDSERIALSTVPRPEGGPGGVVVDQAYTAAHEGTINDHGEVFVDATLDQLVFATDPDTAEPRWVVYPSAGKHATYATIDICENISGLPCVDEDCAPDGVDNPADYDRLPDSFNAGEPRAPRMTDLTPAGFPGDDAWADQTFCGGLGGTGCSSSVLEKLTVDPFP